MTSVQTPSFAHNKIIKPRGKVIVKPILKKIHSGHSDKTSLDLDRSWEEQDPAVAYSLLDSDRNDSSRAGSTGTFAPLRPTGSSLDYGPRARDVSFTLGTDDILSDVPTRAKYTHDRTASGTSHISTGTSNSGRNGSFIHPFQQIPQTSTPPLSHHSYANSLASLDTPVGPRDYSPTITETDKEAVGFTTNSYFPPTPPVGTSRPYHSPVLPHTFQGDSYRSSMTSSHRTNSFSDVAAPSRTTTSRSNSGPMPRSAALNQGRPDQYSSSVFQASDSSPSTPAPIGTSLATHSSSASTAATPLSPLRSSLDMNGAFRLRSRSEVDTATRQENVRQARRKWEEKERVKEEKYAREENRKRERADTKEALRKTQARKSGSFSAGLSSARNSMTIEAPPRKSLGQRMNSFSQATPDTEREKVDFASKGYSDVETGDVPKARADDVRFETTRRPKTTKRKTTGAWTAFVLWFRTRLLKLGRR